MTVDALRNAGRSLTEHSGRRLKALTLTCTAAVGLLAACDSGSTSTKSPSTGTASTTSGASSAGNGRPSRGPGGGGGGLQTFTAVDLDSNGANAADANTANVVTATNAFLATLDSGTKSKVSYAFSDNQSRQTWSNYPAAQVPRKGVALSDLSTKAKAAAMASSRPCSARRDIPRSRPSRRPTTG